MQNPKISVIIPVYNAEKTIGNILDKLISQEYRNIEIIAVNDGSKDDSLKVLQKFAKKDKRVTVVDQKNAGASTARNVGIDKSTGEFITFIDSDDDISDKLISELAKHTKNNSDFIMCGMSINGREVVASEVFIESKKAMTQYVLRSLLTKNLLYGPCCKLFRRSIVVDNNIQFPADVKYGEDTIFVLNYLSEVRNFQAISKSLYTYQFTNTGLSTANDSVSKYREARLKASKLFIKDYPDFKIKTLHMLLRTRWSVAYIKALILRKK